MGGCLAAENGIGKLKRNLLDQNLPQEQKALMAAIKAYFDPRRPALPRQPHIMKTERRLSF